MNTSAAALRRDRVLVRILLASCVLLVLGFGTAWIYRQYVQQQRVEMAYTPVNRVAIAQGNYSMAAAISIKTSQADARWAVQNRLGLEAALQHALLRVDPAAALAPNGLQELQNRLPAELNAILKTDRIQEVLITDFLVADSSH